MNLTENRLYLSLELKKEIHIEDGVSAMIFDTENILESVTFWKGARLKYFGYFSKEIDITKIFHIDGEENSCEIYGLVSSRGEKINAKIEGRLESSHSILDMQLVNFVSEGGMIDLDGVVNIVSGVEKVEGYLTEENIFLGNSGKVRGLPTLLVHSNDVKASHACNMQRIPDEKLFYLRSRGLPKEDATVLMLESYIAKIFWGLEVENEELYIQIKTDILSRIQ